MTQLIDKSALVAEIERRKQDAMNNCGGFKSMREHECDSCIVEQYEEMKNIIDTLEVKEVDLEKEIKEYLSTYWPKEKELHPFLGHMAKYFFELGMQFQTETNITFKYNIGESVREYKA